jgi:molecular chaperone GrpE
MATQPQPGRPGPEATPADQPGTPDQPAPADQAPQAPPAADRAPQAPQAPPAADRAPQAADRAPPAAEQPAPDELAAELEDRWRRALADLDNLRKRYARELAREREVERARVAAAWLPVLDNLERALAHAGTNQGALIEGLRSVRDQAVGVLASLGYPRQDEVGVPFDPARHEAVSVVTDTDAAPGTVVRVIRPGYGEGERQLRPAAVAVAGRRE